MNKTLAITTIALVAVVMGMGTIVPAMAYQAEPDQRPRSLGTWKPCHTERGSDGCVTGQPDKCLVLGRSNVPAFVWFQDRNNDNVQNLGEISRCFLASDNPNAPIRR